MAESYASGAIVSEVALRHAVCPQHLFAWRKAARTGRLTLFSDESAMFVPVVTPVDESAAGKPQGCRSITIEVAGAVVRADASADLRWLGDVLRP